MGYIGIKKITGVISLGQPALGCEIHFEDAENFDELDVFSSYVSLKESLEKLFPNVQVNISRCHEGKISFVTMGITNEIEREENINSVRDKIVEALESGYGYACADDLCTEFCREDNPWVRVSGDDRSNCLVIEYWLPDVNLSTDILKMKLDQINAVAKGAFVCTDEMRRSKSHQISLTSIYKSQQPSGYHVADAVREIVEMLEAACPKNKHYDPDYFRKILV